MQGKRALFTGTAICLGLMSTYLSAAAGTLNALPIELRVEGVDPKLSAAIKDIIFKRYKITSAGIHETARLDPRFALASIELSPIRQSQFYLIDLANKKMAATSIGPGEQIGVATDLGGNRWIILGSSVDQPGMVERDYTAILIRRADKGEVEIRQSNLFWFASAFESEENLCLYDHGAGFYPIDAVLENDHDLVSGADTINVDVTKMACPSTAKSHMHLQFLPLQAGFSAGNGKNSAVQIGNVTWETKLFAE